MGNHQGKSSAKKVTPSEIKPEDDSSESFEDGTNVDIEPLKLKSSEKINQTLADTNEDEIDHNVFMSGLPEETQCEEAVSYLALENDGNLNAANIGRSNPDKCNNKDDDEKVCKSFGPSSARLDQSSEQNTDLVGNATSQLGLRNDTAVMYHVYHEQAAENVNKFVSRIESVNEASPESLTEVSKLASQSLRDQQTENEADKISEVKIKMDTNSNIMNLHGPICYDASGQLKKRLTLDEVDNRCKYIETDPCSNCDTGRNQIYSNVIFLPDKSKGASPKRYGPKRLGNTYSGLKFENSDSDSDFDDKVEDSHSEDDDSSKKETKQEVNKIPLKTVNTDRDKDLGVVNDNRSEHVDNGTEEVPEEIDTLQFVDDHFGLYTGSEASGISQGNIKEPVTAVPNDQAMVTSRPFNANDGQEILLGHRNWSLESNSSQLPVSMNETYPEMKKNDESHGKENNDVDAKDQTNVTKIQNVKGVISDNELVETCAICNKLCDECLCLFPKPVFKAVMTLSCYEHSKPILSYFRYLKIGGKSVDWSTLKSAQAKFAMCLKSLNTSLPDDNRIMLEFNLPSNKSGKTEGKVIEDKLKIDKTVAYIEDEALIKFLENRVNLKEMSMTDSFNSNKHVMVNYFDDTSDEDIVLNEDPSVFDNSFLNDINHLRTDDSESTISSLENSVNSADLNTMFDNTKGIDGLPNNGAIEFTATCSSEDSIDEKQVHVSGLSDSAQSCLEDRHSVTEETVDTLKYTVNTIEDDPVLLENIGLSIENSMEKTESVNAAISDERQIMHIDLQKEGRGIVNENMTNNTTSSTLRRSKTGLEDDNRLSKPSDDEENVDNEVLVTDNHSSDESSVKRFDPETKETCHHFPFLSHGSSNPFTGHHDFLPHQERLKRHLELSSGFGSGTSIEDFLARRYRPHAAPSEFAASFYETEGQNALSSRPVLVNKNSGEDRTIDFIHEEPTRYLDRSRSPSPELSTMLRSSILRSHAWSSSLTTAVDVKNVENCYDDSSSDDDSSLDEAWVKNFEEEFKKLGDFPKFRITVLCVDISESMNGTPWQQVNEFIPKFLSGLEKIRHDHGIREFVAMVTFGHETKIACPSTEDFQQILSYLVSISPGGCSPMLAGLLLSIVCGSGQIGDNASVCKLRLHDIVVNPRIIMLTDGYPSSNKHLTDSDEISEQSCLKAIKDINSYFEDRDREYDIYCVPVGDNANMCFLETLCQWTNGKMFGHTDVEELVRSTHNHYLCAQISSHMFKMPNTDELDKYLFKSLAKELYPEASLVDLVEMEELAEHAYAKLVAEKSEQVENMYSLQDEVNDHYEPRDMANLPGLGTRVTKGPYLSEEQKIVSEMGTITGHSHIMKGRVFVRWDSGQEMMCSYGYEAEVLPNETQESFQVDDEIKLGNKVRRGPDWCYGNTDGGSDQVGAVYDIGPDGVIWVRWPNGNLGNYRFNQDGMFDVLKSDPMDPTGEESFVAAMNRRNKEKTGE